MASAVNVRDSSAIHLGMFTIFCCLTRDKLKYHVARDEGDKLLPMARPNMFLFSLHAMKLKAIL